MPKKEKPRKQLKDNFRSSGAEVNKPILFRMGFTFLKRCQLLKQNEKNRLPYKISGFCTMYLYNVNSLFPRVFPQIIIQHSLFFVNREGNKLLYILIFLSYNSRFSFALPVSISHCNAASFSLIYENIVLSLFTPITSVICIFVN